MWQICQDLGRVSRKTWTANFAKRTYLKHVKSVACLFQTQRSQHGHSKSGAKALSNRKVSHPILDSVSRALAWIGGAIPRDKFLETFLQRCLRAVAEQLFGF